MKYVRNAPVLILLFAFAFFVQTNTASAAITKCIGEPTTLNWSSSNVVASGCTLIPNTNNQASCAFVASPDTSGSRSVNLTSGSCSVSLTCGSASANDTLTIDSTKTWNGTACVTPAATPASTCSNGLNISTYPSCTCPSGQTQSGASCVTPDSAPIAFLSVLPPSCTIANGASTCTSTASWSTSGVSSPALVDGNVNATLSTAPNSSGLTVWVAYPQTVFYLKNGGTTLATQSVTASCASGSAWNGSSCATTAIVYGCTDRNTYNYNPLATVDDGSCVPVTNINCANYPPLTVSLTASPNPVAPNAQTTLTWRTYGGGGGNSPYNYNGCWLNSSPGDPTFYESNQRLGYSGTTLSFPLNSNTTFSMSCSDACGLSPVAQVMVTVACPNGANNPIACTTCTSPATMVGGVCTAPLACSPSQGQTISCSSGANSCGVTNSGTRTVQCDGSYSSCTAGSSSDPTVSVSISASPPRLPTRGGTATLSLSVSGANTCTIKKNSVVWKTLTSSSCSIPSSVSDPAVTTQTKYDITCSNATYSASASSRLVNVGSLFQEF